MIITMALCAALVLCSGCSPEIECVRDMSEVAARGSFVFNMKNNIDKIDNTEDTLVFNTYEEFCESSFSDVVIYQYGHFNDKDEWITDDYKAKNERYNADYFEEYSLLVAFFEYSYSVFEQLVRNVTMTERECFIDVIQTRTVTSASDVAVYACFIETKQQLSYDIKANVSVDTVTFSTDTGLFCYYGASADEIIDADDDEIWGYYIPARSAMINFIADNQYLVDNGLTSSMMKMKYSEEFFEEYALLCIQLPGIYRGLVHWDGNLLSGLRLDSNHYVKKYMAALNEEQLNHTAVAFVAVPKNLEFEWFTYTFESYSEWEEGAAAMKVQSGEITLVRTDNGDKDYDMFIQQGQ